MVILPKIVLIHLPSPGGHITNDMPELSSAAPLSQEFHWLELLLKNWIPGNCRRRTDSPQFHRPVSGFHALTKLNP